MAQLNRMKRLLQPRFRSIARRTWPAIGALLSANATALEGDVRLKFFTTSGFLPEQNIQRQALGTPSTDSTIDLRLMFKHDTGALRFILDHQTILISGDATELRLSPDADLDQTVVDDERRWVDLTWHIEDGNRHRSIHRIDRAALQWQQGDWGLTVGRQAVSWGSGIVFQPMDPFNPFSPTVVDRDYKAGDDLILIDRLFANGSDMQLLHVVRRDEDHNVSSEASSTALKWHGYTGEVEFEVAAARHFDDAWAGLSLRIPLGEAMFRTDVIGMELESGGWHASGLMNVDYSFAVGGRNAYVFSEYFHNDLGVDSIPDDLQLLPQDLLLRLNRGELFNLMKDYLVVGGNIEWHPLLSHSATLITNLHDSSSLFQTNLTYTPSDNQTVQFGWVGPFGQTGDEFGEIPVFTAPSGERFTTGGAHRIYLRWLYYF